LLAKLLLDALIVVAVARVASGVDGRLDLDRVVKEKKPPKKRNRSI
jgi:hypothetical protein